MSDDQAEWLRKKAEEKSIEAAIITDLTRMLTIAKRQLAQAKDALESADHWLEEGEPNIGDWDEDVTEEWRETRNEVRAALAEIEKP